MSVLIALFLAAALTFPAAAGTRLCPAKDIWIIIQMTDNEGKDQGLHPLFLPRGELGLTKSACPEITSDILVPVYNDRKKLIGEITVTLEKGYLDDPNNTYDRPPPNPNIPKKKPAIPRPKKKRQVVPADNIRTWHADLSAPVG